MLLGGGAAQAQDFPTKPITLIIPAGAGGSHDMTARAVTSVANAQRPVLVTDDDSDDDSMGGSVGGSVGSVGDSVGDDSSIEESDR